MADFVEKMKKGEDKSVWELLQEHFYRRFGQDWGHILKLEIRADKLSWFVHLIEEGIKHRIEDYKKQFHPSKTRDGALQLTMEERINIASFRADLEDLVRQIERAPLVPQKKPKRRWKDMPDRPGQ